MTPEELLAEHTEAVAQLAAGVRSIVTRALPDAEERVYRGWHGLGYVDPDAGYVCGIFPRRDEVKLGFEHGYALDHPLLTERGSQIAYAVFRPGDRLPEGLAELIRDAAAIRS